MIEENLERQRRITVAADSGISIRTSGDISDALRACLGTQGLLLTEHDLAPEFFDLHTGLAGELFQKFINYKLRVAIVLPNPEAYGERFGELAYEHRSHKMIRLVRSEEEGKAWLNPRCQMISSSSADVALRLECSVEADVSPAFAWSFRVDVANWNDPPAKFALEGPFAAGSRGTTLLPGQPPIYWLIREVQLGEFFIIEMELDRAALSFEWRFEPLPGNKSRLTQRIILRGENASAYVDQVTSGFGSTLSDGMKRIAAEIERAGRIQ